jgi:hypothetical protein
MASSKQQVRLLLDPATAHEITQIAKKESRSIASVCSVLINQALYQRRTINTNAQRLVGLIKGETSDAASA